MVACDGEPRTEYYQRILTSPTALWVKAADIADNPDRPGWHASTLTRAAG
jgi:hypothetical protein